MVVAFTAKIPIAQRHDTCRVVPVFTTVDMMVVKSGLSFITTAQKGIGTGLFTQGMGLLKEILHDIPKYSVKYDPLYALKESKKDLKNNWKGFILGLNSSSAPEDNPEFNKTNSKSMNFILSEILKDSQ